MSRATVVSLCLLAVTAVARPANASTARVDVKCSLHPNECRFTNIGSIPASSCVIVRVVAQGAVSDKTCSGALDPDEVEVVPMHFTGVQPDCGGLDAFSGCHLMFDWQDVSVEGARKWLMYARWAVVIALILGAAVSLHYWQRRTRKLLDERRGR